MADVYLGTSISAAILLPPIRWVSGNMPGLPIARTKHVDKVATLAGTIRFNLKESFDRRWDFYWDNLRGATMATLLALNSANQTLWFQNNWEDPTWHEVVISSLAYYSPIIKTNICGGYFIPTIYQVPYFGTALYCGLWTDHPSFSLAMTLEGVD